MAIDHPFLTIGKFAHECQPRKISLISRIVSTEADPRAEGHPLLEPFPGSAPADKGSL